MTISAQTRKKIIHGLLPERSDRLLDVGSGPINAAYPYSDKAEQITCVDWNIVRTDNAPENVECIDADFVQFDMADACFDTVIASDVFEHVLVEDEPRFIEKCISVLKPGGHLILSVPHRGSFAWLDPYEIKPAIHRILRFFGLYGKLHNGYCDIRKGHKHYKVPEIEGAFNSLERVDCIYYGYLYHPLSLWVYSFSKYLFRIPILDNFVKQSCAREFERDYGERSFAVVLKFRKPADEDEASSNTITS